MTTPDFSPNRGVPDTPPCLFSPPGPFQKDSDGAVTLSHDAAGDAPIVGDVLSAATGAWEVVPVARPAGYSVRDRRRVR
jgi:hypothetical protein